jgi:Fur family transcriptional regulator, ferric uptake regulator
MTAAAPAPSIPQAALEPIGVAVAPLEKYREFLASKGLRLTRERSIIVEEIFSTHEHFDADKLIERLAQSRGVRRVSRSTIYRSLNLLEEAGLIRKVVRQDDREIFEHDYGYPQHDHLVCRKCGDLIEFHNEAINDVLAQIARQHGFRVEGHRLEVQGLCDACCRPPQSRPKKLNLL